MSDKKIITYYGGQALIEGVMMKGRECLACAVRGADGKIVKAVADCPPLSKKYKILGLPVVRGVVNFFSMMSLAMKTLGFSAEASGMGLEDEEPGKFEKWLGERFGKSIMDVVMGVSMVLGVALALLLFMWLPTTAVKFGSGLIPNAPAWVLTVVEGVAKILIFVVYIVLVSRMPEIRRTFEYHGAEHKTIHCFEHGEPLTVENVRKYRRNHPRCGSAFIMLVLVVSIVVLSFISWDVLWQRLLIKLLLLPVIMGISYELIRVAGRYENVFTKIISFPGMLLQKITVKEPDDSMIECAITSLKIVIEMEHPGSYPEEREGLIQGLDVERTKNSKE